MNYHELSGWFQRSFLGGRFKTWHDFGGKICQFTDLKMSKDAKAIAVATVMFDDEGVTAVIEEPNGPIHKITPLTPTEYAEWKQLQNE